MADPAATSLQPAKPRYRGVSHEIAAIVSPILGVVLIAIAPTSSIRWAAVVYTAGITAMYATSATYHRGHWNDATRVRLRRLDHSMIMVAIAATYTPVAIAALSAGRARVLLGVVWSLALVGVVIQLVWLDAPRWLVAGLYIAIGWTAVAFGPTLWRAVGAGSFLLLVLGGVIYSIGAVVYSIRKPDPNPLVFGFHEVFHVLVIGAGLVFYVAIVQVVLAA